MARPLVSDELWSLIEPLIPKWPPRPKGGRPPVDDRKTLAGILFVLKSGIRWEFLPMEMGCGSGMTCWRRLRDWHKAGVWDQLHRILLQRLQESDRIDWSRAAVDSGSVRAVGGGEKTGPNSTDRGKPGSKHHVLTDADGIPLNVTLTAANRNDVTELLPIIDTAPPVAGHCGHPRHLPESLYADRAYDSEPHRRALRYRRIKPHIPKRNTGHGSGLGIYRWVVERTLSWLHQFRRLRVRFDRRQDIHKAFLTIAASLICFRKLHPQLC